MSNSTYSLESGMLELLQEFERSALESMRMLLLTFKTPVIFVDPASDNLESIIYYKWVSKEAEELYGKWSCFLTKIRADIDSYNSSTRTTAPTQQRTTETPPRKRKDEVHYQAVGLGND